MAIVTDPLTTLIQLLHRAGWHVQLAGCITAPQENLTSHQGVAHVLPSPTALADGATR